MRSRYLVRAVVATLLLCAAQGAPGVAAPAWAQGAPATGVEKTTDDYVNEGREFAMKGKFQEAYNAYMKAWAEKQPFDLACNLAVAEVELNKHREAMEHFTYCEQNFPSVRDEKQEAISKILREFLADTRRKVGVARIRVTRDDGGSAEGTRVFVDGQPVGKIGGGGKLEQPLLRTEDVFVNPGSRRFSARMKGCAEGEAVLAVSPGGEVAPALELACRKTISRGWVIAGASAAAVGVGVGVGGVVYSGSRRTDGQPVFDELKAAEGPGACLLPKNSVKCAELHSAYDDYSLWQKIGIGGVIFGGVAAGATLVYLLTGGSAPKESDSGVQASFGVMPGGGGAVLRGSF